MLHFSHATQGLLGLWVLFAAIIRGSPTPKPTTISDQLAALTPTTPSLEALLVLQNAASAVYQNSTYEFASHNSTCRYEHAAVRRDW